MQEHRHPPKGEKPSSLLVPLLGLMKADNILPVTGRGRAAPSLKRIAVTTGDESIREISTFLLSVSTSPNCFVHLFHLRLAYSVRATQRTSSFAWVGLS